MHAEGDHVIRVVLPESKERMAKRGLNLANVGLHWGVTEQEAWHCKVLKVCLEETERCRPFFIRILGERYRSHLLPPQIEATVFDTLLAYVRASQRPLGTGLTACGQIASAREASQ